MTRCMLFAANTPSKFWCFVLQHSTFIRRRMCSPPNTVTPYKTCLGRNPNIRIFTHPEQRSNVHTNDDKTLSTKATPKVFLGFGPSTAVMYYFSLSINKLNTSHHERIDDRTYPFPEAPSQALLDRFLPIPHKNIPTQVVSYKETHSPFLPENTFEYSVALPPTASLGLI